MIDHGDFLCGKTGDVFLSILAVHRYQQVLLRNLLYIFQGNLQNIHHLYQIALADGRTSAVNKPGILPMVLQIQINTVTAGDSICIRVVMALDYDIPIFRLQQIF